MRFLVRMFFYKRSYSAMVPVPNLCRLLDHWHVKKVHSCHLFFPEWTRTWKRSRFGTTFTRR
jgi:hypothetical protein